MVNSPDSNEPLLAIDKLCVSYSTPAADLDIVDHVSLSIRRGQTVALVGESGCGKTATALAVMGLLPQPIGRVVSGSIRFLETIAAPPVDLCGLSDRAYRAIRGRHIAMIFQEPMNSLNPVITIGEQIAESLRLHLGMKRGPARDETIDLLRRVGMANALSLYDAYPHELSGGMRQRVMIAMAISCKPALLIADEPTTALDVTTQAQILDLLSSLQATSGMSVLLISHDLAMVAQVADYIYVMYAGRVVEHAPPALLFENPAHPYTRGLIACTPTVDGSTELRSIPGAVPTPDGWPAACRFHPRCELSAERAHAADRTAVAIGHKKELVLRRCAEHFDGEESGTPTSAEIAPGHFVACWEAARACKH